MSASHSYLLSTIGRKYMMALTAIVWSLFVFVHMAGNMFIFAGAQAYNEYSYKLTSNPFIYLIEIFLLLFVLVHAITGISLKLRNLKSKPKYYNVQPTKNKNSTITSRTMIYTGFIILAFLIWHLATFKFGPNYSVVYSGIQMRNIYQLILEKFHDPIYMVTYCFIMVFVGMHLKHGVSSIFQTLGYNHPRYNLFFKFFGHLYATVVTLGFISQPIYVYFFSQR